MSEKIPVVIDLMTKVIDGTRKETTNHRLEGTLISKGTSTYIRYIEQTEDTGRVRNVVKMAGNEVTIIRNGAVSMHQQFQKGQVTQGNYGTPFGTMHMETATKRLDYHWKPEEGNGKLELTYQLKLQGRDLGRVTFMLTIREADG
ncbi:MAG TPA: DUF1934 domain-containing protein [Bacillales bacterium]|nr:DUF1934 domain-containing protein [Bacillales bacterium]